MKFCSPLVFSGLLTVSSALLATTTRYYDGQQGACGCGTNSGSSAWQLGIAPQVYTAAGSQALFDTDGAGWCGGGCGKCYNLTSTGKAACTTCGTAEPAGNSIIVMVTNLCPHNGNEEWCPTVGGTNKYGYGYHFDIMGQSAIFGDNPVVEFEPIACPGQAVTDWETCVCHGQTASDETPVGMSVGTQSAPAQGSGSPVSSAKASAGSNSAKESPVADPTTSIDPIAASTLSTVFGESTSAPEGDSPDEPHRHHHVKQQVNACRP